MVVKFEVAQVVNIEGEKLFGITTRVSHGNFTFNRPGRPLFESALTIKFVSQVNNLEFFYQNLFPNSLSLQNVSKRMFFPSL